MFNTNAMQEKSCFVWFWEQECSRAFGYYIISLSVFKPLSVSSRIFERRFEYELNRLKTDWRAVDLVSKCNTKVMNPPEHGELEKSQFTLSGYISFKNLVIEAASVIFCSILSSIRRSSSNLVCSRPAGSCSTARQDVVKHCLPRLLPTSARPISFPSKALNSLPCGLENLKLTSVISLIR